MIESDLERVKIDLASGWWRILRAVVCTAQASELAAACEAASAAIQERRRDVPDAVIVLGSGVERGRLVKLGHWW